MIALLSSLVEGVALIGEYVLWALESFSNLFLGAIAAAAAALLSLLPAMGDSPALGTPSWLGWMNWFYPVGALVDGLVTLVTLWVAFLAIRWCLRLVRAL